MRYSMLGPLLDVVTASIAHAQVEPEGRPVLSFAAENDSFGISPTDRYYTHGSRLGFRHAADDRPFWHGTLAWVPLLSKNGTISHESGLMQLIFTSSRIDGMRVKTGDHPYAGLLAGTMSITSTSAGARRSDQVSMTVGIIGPASLSEQSQKLVHRLANAIEPLGWQTQLGTEPAINLAWRRQWRFNSSIASFAPHVGAAVGNLYDYAGMGASITLGAGQADQYPAMQEPFVAGIGAIARSDAPYVNLLAGVEGRAVARNLFLDGNSFTAGRGVERKTFVGDAFVGVAVRYRGMRVSVRQYWRSREFVRQQDIHRFLAVTFDVRL